MHEMRYLVRLLSASHPNRRLHALGDWLRLTLETLGPLFAHGEVFLLDSMSVAVCRRARARRSCRRRKFFATLQSELPGRAVSASIEVFHNWQRRHVARGYRPPVIFGEGPLLLITSPAAVRASAVTFVMPQAANVPLRKV